MNPTRLILVGSNPIQWMLDESNPINIGWIQSDPPDGTEPIQSSIGLEKPNIQQMIGLVWFPSHQIIGWMFDFSNPSGQFSRIHWM